MMVFASLSLTFEKVVATMESLLVKGPDPLTGPEAQDSMLHHDVNVCLTSLLKSALLS
jgi:hypothetical protein